MVRLAKNRNLECQPFGLAVWTCLMDNGILSPVLSTFHQRTIRHGPTQAVRWALAKGLVCSLFVTQRHRLSPAVMAATALRNQRSRVRVAPGAPQKAPFCGAFVF